MGNKNGIRRVLVLALIIGIFTSQAALLPVGAAASKPIRLQSKKLTLGAADSGRITVKNLPKNAKVKYKSKDAGIVAVDKKGVVQAIGEGSTKIKVIVYKNVRKADSNKMIKKIIKRLTCKVTVKGDGEEAYTPIVSKKFAGNPDADISKGFSSQATDFSVNLFKESVSGDVSKGNNALISPQSVLTDMMMATGGAGGSTLKELSDVMCGTIGYESFRGTLSDYNARLIYSDKVRFHMANSIWIRDDSDRIKVKQSFIDDGETYYNADSYLLPFDQTMVDRVNAWVNEHTFGMIPTLLTSVPPDEDVMHLINALAFDAAWAVPYDNYQVKENQTFTNSKGKKETVSMLSETIDTYLHDDMATGFTKAYAGWEYEFVAILPNEGVSVNDYLKSMTGDSFRSFISSGKYGYDVYTRMPEFSYDYTTEMNQALENMGIKKAFMESADFSNMADTKSGALYINTVVHKTHIELDRNGTKAAAVTDIGMSDATSVGPVEKEKIYIYLDRPFIYAIIQRETGIPVFMGVVNSVEGK